MPCDTKPNLSEVAKQSQRAALARLEAALAAGSVTMSVSRQGAVAFKGWAEGERGGLADLCAYRRLTASNSPALRKALARAEALAGVKVDKRMVNAGVHSHDGGASWHEGH